MLDLLVHVIQQTKTSTQLISQVATIISNPHLSHRNKISSTFQVLHNHGSQQAEDIFKEMNTQFFACLTRMSGMQNQVDDVHQFLDLMYNWVLFKMKTANDMIDSTCTVLSRFRSGGAHYYRLVTMILQFLFQIMKTFKVDEKAKQLVLKIILLRAEEDRDQMEHPELIVVIQTIIEFLTVSKHSIRFYKVLSVIHDYKQKMKASYSNLDAFNDKNLQIMLAPFFHYVRIRRDRLKSMTTLYTHTAKCPIFMNHLDSYQGPAQTLGSVQALNSLENDILFQIAAAEPRSGSVEWDRRVTQIVSILSQQVNPEIFNFCVRTEQLINQSNETAKAESKFKFFVPNYTVSMLNEAFVYRILQLVNEKECMPSQQQDMFRDVSQGVVGKWILLADQLYSLMSVFKEIDFRKIITGESLAYENLASTPMNLKKALHLYGDSIKDHFVIWIILQIMPLYAQHSSSQGLTSDLLNLISELMHRKYTCWKPHEQELIHYNYLFIMQRLANLKEINFVGKFMSKHVQKWREETEGKLDFYNLDEVALKNLFLLSSYLTQPISSEILDFLKAPETKSGAKDIIDVDADQHDLMRLPSAGLVQQNILVKGKRRPLSPNLLLILSAHSRRKLFDLLEEVIYEKETKDPIPPSLVETFVRILYCSPSFYCSAFKLTHSYGTMDTSPKYMIIEMVNFRLMRFFKYTSTEKLIAMVGAHMKIFVDSQVNEIQNYHRLYLNVENLFLKVMLYLVNDITKLHGFITKHKASLKNQFGESVRRTIVFTTARVLKIRGITGAVNMDGANQIMKLLIDQCQDIFNDLLYTESRMQLYTASLKASFDKRKQQQSANKSTKPTHLADITAHIAQQSSIPLKDLIDKAQSGKLQTAELEHQASHIRSRLRESETARNALLSALWFTCYVNKPDLTASLEHLKFILNNAQTAFEFNTNIYRFVNYLLDEFIPAISANDQSDPPSYVKSIGDFLCKFIWEYEFIPLETFVLAMSDRAGSRVLPSDSLSTQTESIYVIPLLNYILLTDTRFIQRVQYYISLAPNPSHWEEEDYYAKHIKYHDKYPELWGINVIKQANKKFLLPVYYGNVCLRMIPILDIFVRRLVELGENQFVISLLDQYGDLFAYHDNCITFIKQVFMYYGDSPHSFIFDESVKKRLIKLAAANGANFSKELMSHVSGEMVDLDMTDDNEESKIRALFSPQYLVNSIRDVAAVMPSITRSSANDVSPKDRFLEFPSPFEKRLNELVIELLALPFKTSELIPLLIDSVTRSCEYPEEFEVLNKIDTHRMCSCLGVILASLPQPSTSQYVIEYMRSFLMTNPSIQLSEQIGMTDEALIKGTIQSEQHVGESYVDNYETSFLAILHAFFSNSSLESVNVLRYFIPECYTKFSPKSEPAKMELVQSFVLNIKHVYFIAKLVGPLVSLLRQTPFASPSTTSNNNPLLLLERFFIELAKCLCAVNIDASLLPEQTTESIKHPLEKITGRKRLFEEMNDEMSDTGNNSVLFPILNADISLASLPINQQQQDEEEVRLFEQIMDLLQHMHYLLYANGQMPAATKTGLLTEINQVCTNGYIKASLQALLS